MSRVSCLCVGRASSCCRAETSSVGGQWRWTKGAFDLNRPGIDASTQVYYHNLRAPVSTRSSQSSGAST
eukprot:9275353-Lingulodinium_polyedra.AAC.1